MTREKLAEEQRRLVRVQKAILSASKEPHSPALDDLIESVAQLTLTVSELLKEHRE
jgi:hypothetical protein